MFYNSKKEADRFQKELKKHEKEEDVLVTSSFTAVTAYVKKGERKKPIRCPVPGEDCRLF